MNDIFIEDEPEFSAIFNSLTPKQRVKLLKKAIREETDSDCRKVYKYLLSELRK